MSTSSQCTPISLNGRTIAVLRAATLDVRRRPDGLIRLPSPALALAVSTLAQARALGCRDILLTVAGGGRFRITLAEFLSNGFEVQRGKFERQLACPLSAFKNNLRVKPSEPRQLPLGLGDAP